MDNEREASSGMADHIPSSAELDGLYLLLAMAPMEEVFRYFEAEKDSRVQQELFADAVRTAWNDEHGPSKSYLRHVCRQYISLIGEHHVESDALLALLLEMLTACTKNDLPDPKEYCYLSYRIRPPGPQPQQVDDRDSAKGEPLRLRLRVFPHHNDVSLRLWEAGAALAEYVHAHPILVRGRHVVELGAGVGLTGLVCLACGASRMTCTDYTQHALDNLRFNHRLFRDETERKSSAGVSAFGEFEALYLDWDDAGGGTRGDGQGTTSQHGLAAVADATVLLAADVVYDVTAIPSLVRVLRFFLESSSPDADGSSETLKPRTVLLAATIRNRESLARLLQLLAARGIAAQTLVAAAADSVSLSSSLDPDRGAPWPRLVATRFVQPRSHVHIYALEMQPCCPLAT